MNNRVQYIELYQTVDPALLSLIKSSLVHHKIRHEIYDEQTAQNANIAAFGYSGARILVHPADQEDAIELLMNVIPDSFMPGDDSKMNSFVYQLEKRLSPIPIINKIPGLTIILGFIVLTVIITSVILLNS